MRTAKAAALVLAVGLVPLVVGAWLSQDRQRDRARFDAALTDTASLQADALESAFERGRSIDLLLAHNPVFRDFYRRGGSVPSGAARHAALANRANEALDYLEHLNPGAVGEACFIDQSGREVARVVRGVWAKPAELSPDESTNPFFSPTFALPAGKVYQAQPYVSPDTHEWVISNSTRVPGAPAIVHYEITVESLRRGAKRAAGDVDLAVIDAQTGRVVIDSALPQGVGVALGRADSNLAALAGLTAAKGVVTLGGRRVAYRTIASTTGNANRWIVAASAPAQGRLGTWLLPLAAVLAATIAAAFAMAIRWSRKSEEADTDPLTGLGNRRRLLLDVERAGPDNPSLLAIFDLDGFKNYNDAFGHPAGDALLARFGRRLGDAVRGHGAAYRLGGDEFCVLAPADAGATATVASALAALSERGEGFTIGCTHGVAQIPVEASTSSAALRLADERLYAAKQSGRRSPGRQSADVLQQVLHERSPALAEHLADVAEAAVAVAERLGLDGSEVEHIRQAAQLHDVGKIAVPDAILEKPGPLDDEEWGFVRSHTVIGQRIVCAAPALSAVGRLIRSSHERWDGTGYPDRLAGAAIPLGSRIIAVCDAYDAMRSDRPYREASSHEGALAELRRCAGTQFDTAVVDAFVRIARERHERLWRAARAS
jgi:diguanylate cyclase (GGDEF)-like protein